MAWGLEKAPEEFGSERDGNLVGESSLRADVHSAADPER
jgi:hypothetical protein